MTLTKKKIAALVILVLLLAAAPVGVRLGGIACRAYKDGVSFEEALRMQVGEEIGDQFYNKSGPVYDAFVEKAEANKRAWAENPWRVAKWNAQEEFADPKVVALCKAIEERDLAKVERALADGADAKAVGKSGATPLLWLCLDETPSAAIANRLLDAGADPNVETTDRLSPRNDLRGWRKFSPRSTATPHLILRSGDVALVRRVLAAGFDPSFYYYSDLSRADDGADWSDNLPRLALWEVDEEIYSAILEQDFSVDALNEALYRAIYRPNAWAIRALIKAGADWKSFERELQGRVEYRKDLRAEYVDVVAAFLEAGADPALFADFVNDANAEKTEEAESPEAEAAPETAPETEIESEPETTPEAE
ncbi:MAG: hypothetical protein J6K20_03925 [Thermoguttaceae bacterium]|nr:hypothetical protein [Thermoguttaceae bacterium]